MSRENRVIPECYVDTLLIDIAGFKSPNHQNGISDVVGIMRKNFKNRVAVGVVDDDKNKPKYINECVTEKEENDLVKLKHPDSEHYFIVIHPDAEGWIFESANKVGVDPKKYGFRSVKQFKGITKSQNVSQNQNVKQFLNNIKQKKNSPFNTIVKWINEILRD